MRDYIIQSSYLVASILFILGLRGLTAPKTARRGIQLAAVGMLIAVVGTLLHQEIITYTWIVIGLVVGTIIGVPMAVLMPMTAVPQRTAISHAFGALAVTLVGISEYYRHGGDLANAQMAALGFEVMFGSLTITGSFMAFGKLQGFVRGAPVTYPLQNPINVGLFSVTSLIFLYLIFNPGRQDLFYAMVALGVLIGVLIVLPIGGADMPVVISLLNSYAGLAAAATGIALNNNVLIVAGALDGASGFILSVLMSKAMNRSFTNVLFGRVGAVSSSGKTDENEFYGGKVKSASPEEVAMLLDGARRVVVVPGYGMAVSQAQHAVRDLFNLLESKGVEVEFGIHPVAGRMPGHMNVLLAEANIPYDKLREMDDINSTFEQTDVAIVIGANDTVNTLARTDPKSPIAGMPIMEVGMARTVIVIKRSLSAGFAGIPNPLFAADNTLMLYADAKQGVQACITAIKQS